MAILNLDTYLSLDAYITLSIGKCMVSLYIFLAESLILVLERIKMAYIKRKDKHKDCRKYCKKCGAVLAENIDGKPLCWCEVWPGDSIFSKPLPIKKGEREE
jgi:hypothetical protein